MITYLPSLVKSRIASKKLIEKLINNDLTLNQGVVKILVEQGLFTRKKLEEVALKVLKSYKKNARAEIAAGAAKRTAQTTALAGRKLLVARVNDLIRFEVTESIKDQYHGTRYVWLPSSAKVPDPEHQLKYGKTFVVGDGEMPGDRYGCQCGMRILTDDDQLDL